MRTGSTSGTSQTAVIVPVAAAEPVVGQHRATLDVASAWGVPAHVTVLYPFAPPARVDTRLCEALQTAIASVSAFDCTFADVGWFGQDVLWLAPSPSETFRDLTRAVLAAFPDFPPYGGAHEGEPTPHLTVGELALAGSVERLRSVESDVLLSLPIASKVDVAWLIAGDEAAESWRLVHEFPLGG